MVVELSPEKGSTDDKGAQTVEAGSTVNIVLSSGKVKVPSLVGLTKDQAIAALTAQDVLLNTNIETVQTNERPAGTVLSQSSAAGTLVAQNSTVTIRVAATPLRRPLRLLRLLSLRQQPVTRTLLLVTSNVLPRLTSRLLSLRRRPVTRTLLLVTSSILPLRLLRHRLRPLLRVPVRFRVLTRIPMRTTQTLTPAKGF